MTLEEIFKPAAGLFEKFAHAISIVTFLRPVHTDEQIFGYFFKKG